MKVALISLEPWDAVWRRNQHLSAELVRQGLVRQLLFIEPASRGAGDTQRRKVMEGITAVTPTMPIPRTLGGLVELGRRLSRSTLSGVDLLWLNDPTLGVHSLSPAIPAIYDVTDDWRTAGSSARIRRRISRAERRLAGRAGTIVCSPTLQARWLQRYGLNAPVVNNGVDLRQWSRARARELGGPRPHVGYVGTLHEDRLDVDLLVALATAPGIGTVHLVGPDCLGAQARTRLMSAGGISIHGPVPAAEVPSCMLGMDVLLSPHRVSDFTLSLDAIKAYEYATSGRPVVATPTSGFAEHAGRMTIAEGASFVAEVQRLAARTTKSPHDEVFLNDAWSWGARAREFWSHLQAQASHGVATVGSQA